MNIKDTKLHFFIMVFTPDEDKVASISLKQDCTLDELLKDKSVCSTSAWELPEEFSREVCERAIMKVLLALSYAYNTGKELVDEIPTAESSYNIIAEDIYSEEYGKILTDLFVAPPEPRYHATIIFERGDERLFTLDTILKDGIRKSSLVPRWFKFGDWHLTFGDSLDDYCCISTFLDLIPVLLSRISVSELPPSSKSEDPVFVKFFKEYDISYGIEIHCATKED